MYTPASVKENSASIYFTLIIFVLHSYVDIRGIGPTDLHDRCIALSGKKLVTAPPLRYEVLADRFVRPKTRKSQNKYFVQIVLKSAYPILILIGINDFCANMIK